MIRHNYVATTSELGKMKKEIEHFPSFNSVQPTSHAQSEFNPKAMNTL
jgi:hypothetical protein